MQAKTRTIVAVMTGIWGGIVMTGMGVSNMFAADFLLITMAATSAGIAGYVTAPMFGHRAKVGAGIAVLAGVLATGLGAVIGGALFALLTPENVAIMMAPVAVGAWIFSAPGPLLLWAGCLTAIHLAALGLRSRDARVQAGMPFN